MRIDVKKYLFFGSEKEKHNFFLESQKLGLIEFIDKSNSTSNYPAAVKKLQDVLTILKRHFTLPSLGEEEVHALLDPFSIADKILDLSQQIESSGQRLRIIEQEFVRVSPFGNFSMQNIEFIQNNSGRSVRFFSKKQCEEDNLHEFLREHPELFFIKTAFELHYFISIDKQGNEKVYPELSQMEVKESPDQLHQKLLQEQERLEDLKQKLHKLAEHAPFLQSAYLQQLNIHNLLTAQSYTEAVLDGSLFAIEGWVAENREEELHKFLYNRLIHAEEIAIEENDKVPSHLENKGLALMGEDLIGIYDTPSTKDKDPSLWVLCSFALFFAMIIGDAGYGLIFLASALFMQMKSKKLLGVKKRMINLFTILSTCTVLFGVLTNSFFGMQLASNHPLRQISAVQWISERKAEYHVSQQDDVYQDWIVKYPELKGITDYKQFLGYTSPSGETPIASEFSGNILLELSLVIGILHLTTSLLRGIRSNLGAPGWIVFLIGSYLYFPSVLYATSMGNFLFGIEKAVSPQIGLPLIYLGIAWAFCVALFKSGILGILGEIMMLIQVFSDVMSYLRLYALALSGAMMSSTFNSIGEKLPFILGVIVIVLGHLVNIALNIMGGVIHGLRLNFLEWYHYSFEGGGKKFTPLKIEHVRDL